MSSETRTTPGPWACWDMDEFGWHVFAVRFGTRDQGQDCRLSVAAVRPGRSHIEPADNYYEQVANAHLIAAAPVMREALVQAEACMSIVTPRSDKAEYLRILGVVRAALAAADGSTER